MTLQSSKIIDRPFPGVDSSHVHCRCPAARHDDPFHLEDLARARGREVEDRRARYRGFEDVGHFLDVAADRVESGNPAGVEREYRVIFQGADLETIPFLELAGQP